VRKRYRVEEVSRFPWLHKKQKKNKNNESYEEVPSKILSWNEKSEGSNKK
jgi:hypothetical protein